MLGRELQRYHTRHVPAVSRAPDTQCARARRGRGCFRHLGADVTRVRASGRIGRAVGIPGGACAHTAARPGAGAPALECRSPIALRRHRWSGRARRLRRGPELGRGVGSSANACAESALRPIDRDPVRCRGTRCPSSPACSVSCDAAIDSVEVPCEFAPSVSAKITRGGKTMRSERGVVAPRGSATALDCRRVVNRWMLVLRVGPFLHVTKSGRRHCESGAWPVQSRRLAPGRTRFADVDAVLGSNLSRPWRKA